LFFYGQTLGDRIVVESMNIEKGYNISSVQNILKHTEYICAGIGRNGLVPRGEEKGG
jgi:hypothetical protein